MPAEPLRLQVISDLHLEFHRDRGRELLEKRLRWDPSASAVVLAGDIGVAGRHRATLELAFEFFSSRFEQVFYVPGNHEFYGTRAPETQVKLRKLVGLYPKVTLLEPGVVGRWGDRRVVGGTLWFPFGPTTWELSDGMSDFHAIKEFRPWVYQQNEEAVAWLTETVREGDVVMTHHLPSRLSVTPRFQADPLGIFYVCELGPLIEQRRPALWIHGHTHEACDYRLGATRVVAKPYGYPDEAAAGFVPLTVALPEDD
jgi:predicted phosphodiesterase